jgi:hypothetical protein
LGDITEEKDNHPSVVVNKIVRGINSLEQIVLNHSKMSKAIPKLYILKGNHDFIDEHLPYFGFLENVFQNIVYIQNPCTISDNMGFVPYIKEATRILDLSKLILYTNVMFMHQPVVGALMNKQIGMKDGLDLTGIDTPIFSGHVHIPQWVGSTFYYVGSPYQIYFGENHKGSIVELFLNDGHVDSMSVIDLSDYFPRKVTLEVSDPTKLYTHFNELRNGDFAKFRVQMGNKNYLEYHTYSSVIQDFAKKNNVTIKGIEFILPEQIIEKTKKDMANSKDEDYIITYANSKHLAPESVNYGLDIMEMRDRENINDYSLSNN